ncbi:MAG TPA: ABC transporter ATP-binding protein [Candidatus Eisenbacteria bacterium]|nr:ABC transporter ATP-binding protein [Candidatus Eisenbacteria bacterium]
MTSENAISIRGLVKSYGTFRAVDGISLEVRKGDFLAFLGPNGAGKTTTINAITGLGNFQEGSVRVFGHDVVRDYRRARRLVGLCPQEFNFDPFLSIEGLLVYQAGYFGVPRAEAAARAERLLGQFGLSAKKNQDFRKLSGGMKRRLLLCRALMHDPEVLILDEPTAGADLEVKHFIWDLLKSLNDAGKTIFLTTHYMEEAERLSKTVVIIDKGRVIHEGSKEELVRDQSLEKRYLELTREKSDDAD